MRDNARPHVTWSTKHLLLENRISFMEWPAMRSDLNPIENVWAVLEYAPNSKASKPLGREETGVNVELLYFGRGEYYYT